MARNLFRTHTLANAAVVKARALAEHRETIESLMASTRATKETGRSDQKMSRAMQNSAFMENVPSTVSGLVHAGAQVLLRNKNGTVSRLIKVSDSIECFTPPLARTGGERFDLYVRTQDVERWSAVCSSSKTRRVPITQAVQIQTHLPQIHVRLEDEAEAPDSAEDVDNSWYDRETGQRVR